MSALQAGHGTPQRSLGEAAQKPADEKGWISRATYDSLPAGGCRVTRPETVSREEVDKISALSPAHRLTVEKFLQSGRWVISDTITRSTAMSGDGFNGAPA